MAVTRDRDLAVLRGILAFAILSTGLHFTHNFVELDSYPEFLVSNEVIELLIPITWPLYTALALLGYRWYARGRVRPARVALVAYGLFVMTSLLHFAGGTPDVPPFWFATIFTDALGGLAVIAFVVRSARPRSAPAA